jgi:hypothetical protein
MAIYKKVSIQRVLDEFRDLPGMNNTKNEPKLIQRIITAETAIGYSPSNTKWDYCISTATHCTIPLPCGTIAVSVVVQGEIKCSCQQFYQQTYPYWQSSMAFDNSYYIFDYFGYYGMSFCFAPLVWKIIDNCIVFDRDVDGKKFTIGVNKIVEGADGLPMINENHVRACLEFLKWKNDDDNLRDRNLPKHLYSVYKMLFQEDRAEWGRLCALSRGDDDFINEDGKARIAAMLHDPLGGIGIPLLDMNSINIPWLY